MTEARNADPRFADSPGKGSALLWIGLALAFVASFLAIRYSAPAKPGGGVDYSWTPTDLVGKPTPLSSFKGRPIFLNIWATWCGPCTREMPSIARLASNPSLVGKVDFICVATDESIETVRRFVAEAKLPMTILHDPGRPPPTFRTEGIPATFLIAPDGRIVRVAVGSEDWDRPEVVKLLQELAAEVK